MYQDTDHIYLRNFERKDKEIIGRCVAHRIPFGPKGIVNASVKEIIQEIEYESILIIADKKSDTMLGTIEFIKIGNILISDCWLFPWYEDNTSFDAEAIEKFIIYVKESRPKIKKIRIYVSDEKPNLKMAVMKNGFTKINKPDWSNQWEIIL